VFVKDCASIAQPLTTILKGENGTIGRTSRKKWWYSLTIRNAAHSNAWGTYWQRKMSYLCTQIS